MKMVIQYQTNFFLFYLFFAIIFVFPFKFVLSATSDNYQLTQESAENNTFDANSDNFEFKGSIGDLINGQSSSNNYLIDHGQLWFSDSNQAVQCTVTIKWAVPQSRVGADGTNWDSDFYLSILTSNDNDNVVIYTTPNLIHLDEDGTHTDFIELPGINPGVYDIGIKTTQHITKVLDDVNLINGNTVLNFSQLDNSDTLGNEVLLAGDINNDGNTVNTLGDDVVNSIDLSIILEQLDVNDPTGNDYRSNLNQDTVINSVDLSIMLDNLDKTGDN